MKLLPAEKTMTVTEFKAKCLRILDELDSAGLIITKRGRPVARVLPVEVHARQNIIGSMKGRLVVKGDLMSTGLEWDAES